MKLLKGLLLFLCCLFMSAMVVLASTGIPLIEHIEKIIGELPI